MKQTIKLNENDLHKMIAESVKRVLKEGTTDVKLQKKWGWILNNFGAEEMLECIFAWSSPEQLEKYIEWFESEDYLQGFDENFANY